MKSNLLKRIAVLATVAVMGMSAAACGGKSEEAGAEASTALTEEEYVAKTEELAQSMTEVMNDAAALDPDDVEGAKAMIEGLKAPFVEFAALEAPEKYAATQEKYKTGCEAMIEYLDMCTDLMDPDKAADVDMDKLTTLLTTIQNDFTEAATLMEEASK